jgi:hypothetical protein
MRQIFALAHYRYASTGEAPGSFTADDLDNPFPARRRWLRPTDR